jgi:NAD(P)-dependent dehydrogenase (short-subunit alcohol dehydrogenase family)
MRETMGMILKDKVAVVTGGASGMGKEISKLFANHGANVVVADINLAGAQKTVAEITAKGGKAIATKTDVSIISETDAMIDLAVAEYGKLDILVNNAGIMDDFGPIGDLLEETWNRIWKVNTSSVLFASKKAINVFMRQGLKGSIVNIASVGGLFGGKAGVAYTESKHAIIGITKNTGYVYGDKGIRCNAIAPGGVKTNIMQNTPSINQFGMERSGKGMQAMIRMGEADEIAEVALFLASDISSFVNGTVVTVDGGWTAC